MIQLSLDTSDKHVLRVTASYLLALAGDISAEITGADKPVHINEVWVKKDSILSAASQDAISAAVAAERDHFKAQAAVLAESNENWKEGYEAMAAGGEYVHPIDPDVTLAVDVPSAASVFGGEAPKPAPSTAVADQSLIAPVATTATILVPPLSGFVLPAQNTESVASPAVPPTANPVPTVEVDKNGLPWDARIHSREKTKVVAGTWKYKRGVDDATVATVEAQLRAAMAVPTPQVVAPEATAPAATTMPTPPVSAPPASAAESAPIGVSIAPAASDQTEAPALSATAQATPTTFPEFMKAVSEAVQAQKITQLQVIEAVKAAGLENLPTLAARNDLVPTVWATLQVAAGGA